MADVTYYFNSYDVGTAWTTNPENMVDGDVDTFAGWEASTVEQLNDGNTCPGTNLGTITKVELRLFGKISGGASQFWLTPAFSGGDGDVHNLGSISFSGDWSSWEDITSDTNAPGSWSWSDVSSLDCLVTAIENGGSCMASKLEIKVTYTAAGPTMKQSNSYTYY